MLKRGLRLGLILELNILILFVLIEDFLFKIRPRWNIAGDDKQTIAGDGGKF